ncbi:hypothetical protein QJ856_gp1045 [Tupanvirus deep ocean]|uniref:Uncharacterized protein n=2 Tax=Tupanvirus TaxID=2094720 RepID=A0AC62A7G2_9VIRU|nr:hypothetical protein QJ856_gp1045 [Tupanvirus deep ocean]QKU33712.1 hypothetical protein [Tupanvirus deep ocean]
MTTTKIIWTNNKVYDHQTIVDRMEFVKKGMNGLLPLYGKEKERLITYAQENNLEPYEMFSLRNTIRIQNEIDSSKRFVQNIDRIKNKFLDLLREISVINDQNQINLKIRYFLKSIQMPVFFVLKTISVLPEFKNLTESSINYIKKIEDNIHATEIEIRKRSMDFEYILENYLKSLGIQFRTEADIKRDKDYNITPDILFDENITLELNGIEYQVRWLDAKNYVLTNTPFIMKSLRKQAEKYNNAFGMGAFVFHYGFDSSIQIPGVIMLDGSKLDK